MAKLLGKRVIPKAKMEKYLLNPDSTDGKGKEKFFTSFGFMRANWAILADALDKHAEERDIEEEKRTPFGLKTTLRCCLETPDGRNPCVFAVWILDEKTGHHSFVTAYPG